VDFFLAFEHGDKFCEAAAACVGTLGLVEAEEDGVAVDAVEAFKKCLGGGLVGQGCGKVLWHLDFGLGGVCVVPLAIGFGNLDGLEALGLHPAGCGQRCDFAHIDLGPDAPGPARHKTLDKGLGVPGTLLAIDPAIAERAIERLLVGDRRDVAALFGDLKPNARGNGVLRVQESLPGQCIGEAHHGELVFGVEHRSRCSNAESYRNRTLVLLSQEKNMRACFAPEIVASDLINWGGLHSFNEIRKFR
jgi:hypothetical protein